MRDARMEAALFVPTGSMANQIAVKVLSRPGGEVICEEDCHLIHHEAGACAILAQVQLRGLAGRAGVLDRRSRARRLRPDDPFQPPTDARRRREHPQREGRDRGRSSRFTRRRRRRARRWAPALLDGARMFNACVASGRRPTEYAALCDLVTISLYKGLAAPMGSLVCGRA